MATRQGFVSGKVYTRRDIQVREHVITLVKYLETVIHDIKYVVGDLQILLEQIDLVSRELDDCTDLPVNASDKSTSATASPRCAFSWQTAPSAFTNPLLNRAKRPCGPAKRTKRTSKSRKYMQEENSSPLSWSSCDGSVQRRKDSLAEMDSVSVELNAMWDNAFDSDLLTGSWTDGTTIQADNTINDLDSGTKPVESFYSQQEDTLVTSKTSWLESTNLEHSLTSGIEMLSFTDESEEDCLSSTFSFCPAGSLGKREEVCISVDPYHVCCQDVIPVGSGRTYCGVYEAALDACLETYSEMANSESFTSEVSLFGCEDVESMVSGTNYEPRYDTQLNTWTAFTMVPIESLHTSEDELSETALDILNDNVPSSPLLDNVSKTINANTETVLSTEADTRHITSTMDGREQTTNAYILSC